jgi:hypothetical protein
MIWGEADCFVQYNFPAQQQNNPPGTPVIRHGKDMTLIYYCQLHTI